MTKEKAEFIVDVFSMANDKYLRSLNKGTIEGRAAERIADRYAQLRGGMCFNDATAIARIEFLMSID